MRAATLLLEMTSAGERMESGSAADASVQLRKQFLERWGTTNCKSIQEQSGRRGCDEVVAMTTMMGERMLGNVSMLAEDATSLLPGRRQ